MINPDIWNNIYAAHTPAPVAPPPVTNQQAWMQYVASKQGAPATPFLTGKPSLAPYGSLINAWLAKQVPATTKPWTVQPNQPATGLPPVSSLPGYDASRFAPNFNLASLAPPSTTASTL